MLQEGEKLLEINADKSSANLISQGHNDDDSEDIEYNDPVSKKKSTIRQRDTFSKNNSNLNRLSTIVHKKRDYQSRRNKNYDDSDSQGDDDHSKEDNSGSLKYKDTAGNSIETKPNAKMVQFRHMFTNLLQQ